MHGGLTQTSHPGAMVRLPQSRYPLRLEQEAVSVSLCAKHAIV